MCDDQTINIIYDIKDDDYKEIINLEEMKKCLLNHSTIKSVLKEFCEKYSKNICYAIIMDLINNNNDINIKYNNDIQKEQQSKLPLPFLPSISELITKNIDWNKLAIDDSEKNFKIRILRVSLSIIVCSIYLLIATYYKLKLSVSIGVISFIIYTLYFIIILNIVFSVGINNCFCRIINGNEYNNKLYRIHSINKKPNKWANINISYIQLLYKNYSIQSISELSAINGSITKIMLSIIGVYTFVFIIIHYASQLYSATAFPKNKNKNVTIEWE